ncbi:hypothetical protein ACPOL_5374 [Acidisarcina polymorpha]|uniref:Glycoside hydrolase family 38 N-terminal domain-containing protein n=1 Tax=Acidisarcina polymorpha TaxID=2211140 RepID=A0A2Z5G5Y2_9BACT|nr:DUF5054 domain-containing protein [Acidisarcina polymorpha]AXC14622.1 hypothetical protein ACPOL_5374 [Acidisarcina polymorpha]
MHRRDFVKSLTVIGTQALLKPGISVAQDKPRIAPAPDASVKRVLVMFKCHFDAGFIDTQANVVRKYFDNYFPEAIEIAGAENSSGRRRYTWTTGSWLLYEYLEQASDEDRKKMELAIARNDIAWHALPFTWQTEMLDPSMMEGSLAISRALDARFGRTTTGAKMTDVPGHTRAIVPALAKHGINFLDIGVNDASTPAQVPAIFLWKDPSGASLPVMYHLGYGGTSRIPGSDLAVAIEVRGDNSGPHPPKEIAEVYERLAYSYPKAEITAASLSEIANAVQPHGASLPMFTGEIGDTWIHGVASDPLKVSRYREVARLRGSWIAKKQMRIGDDTDLALLRHLLLEVEHTWGTDTKTWLDFENYTPNDLRKMLETKDYKVVQFSWEEKRKDLLEGIATLPESLRDQAKQAIDSLTPKLPLPTASAIPHLVEGPIETTHFTLAIEAQTGAITQLRNKQDGREWASKANPLGLFTYQTLSKQDYDRFIADYIVSKADWAFKDFGKPNIEKFDAKTQDWHPHVTELLLEELPRGHRVLATLEIDDTEALRSGRAAFPRQLYLELLLPSDEPIIHLNLYWFQKPATRLPEAMWLTFNPIVETTEGWRLDKSGESISPFEVVTSGNRHMHAVSNGFHYRHGQNSFVVETLDAPLIALGARTPLGFSNSQPQLSSGIHSNLYNNAWGTNYIMWYGEDMRFRYVLRP